MKTKLVAVSTVTLLAMTSGVFAQGGGSRAGGSAAGTGTGVPVKDGTGVGAPVGAGTQQSQPAQSIHAPDSLI
jgi:hypothetical protein